MNNDRELLVRIDERVADIRQDMTEFKREMRVYRRELESLKKRVYSICGGLAVVQFIAPLASKLSSAFLGNHPH